MFDYDVDGSVRAGAGEWWFSWVLEGRAVQDVWISPQRALRCNSREPQATNNRYGTSLRHFDREAGLWRIAWTNPVTGAVDSLWGRRDGSRIELLGEDNDDSIRWTFSDISDQSFVWTGDRRSTDGTWRREARFDLRKITTGGGN